MTNETEQLRDRIAKILSLTYTSGPAKVTFEDIAAAQAIIDELGLTVETGHITGQGYGLPGVIGKRVVGKWEKQ